MTHEKPRILVVDDDPVNLDVLVRTLEPHFFLVIARNGDRALELAKASPPDLVFLDILMPPGPDGFAVCRALKAHPATAGVPVIFLSVMEDPEQKHEGFAAGGVDYVTKPFHADEVLARARTHITMKLLREQLESRNASMGLELHEKNRQLENLMHNLPGLVYRGQADDARTLSFVSHGAQRLVGLTPDECLACGLMALVHEDDREVLQREFRAALQEQRRFQLTYRMLTAWGEMKWVCELGSGVDTPDGPAVEGFISDITETQRRETDMRMENQALRERLKARCAGDMVGASPAILEVFELIGKAAAVDDNVVVYGESGTGKELAARAIHQCSARYEKPFVAVNCGAIPESLFESELFGYKKGAFTGAHADKKGFLDQADGGTLFLDELGEISLMGQVKLLRAIEHGGFTPVGGNAEHRPNVRIVAATNRDLMERVEAGAMRRDFYYRIHVIPIVLPPLRDRKSDIPLLVEHFLKAYPSNKRGHLDSDLFRAFMSYQWPGNVRELQNVLYQYLSLGTARLGDTLIGRSPAASADPADDVRPLTEALAAFERTHILAALQKNDFKRGPTADQLGIDRRTLFRKMKELKIEE